MLYCRDIIVLLDSWFMHRTRGVEGKDGNPANEVRMLAAGIVHGDGVLAADSTIRYQPDTSITGLAIGAPIDLAIDQVEHLAEAYFDTIAERSAGTGEIGPIQDVFRALVEDTARTRQIAADIAAAVNDGRNVLVLTQWTEHRDALAADLTTRGLEPLVLKGGLAKKVRTAVTDQLAADLSPSGQLLMATGSYLGEGFDAPSLDTLFLAFPLAFKGRVVQYIGRILRTTDTKTHIEVHDYLDPGPLFRKMHAKRLTTCKTLGFDPPPRR